MSVVQMTMKKALEGRKHATEGGPFCRLCLIHAGIVGAASLLDRRFQSQLFLACLYKHLSSL